MTEKSDQKDDVLDATIVEGGSARDGAQQQKSSFGELLRRRSFLGALGTAAASLPLLKSSASFAGHDHDDDDDDSKGNIVIKKQGSFSVGGKKVQAPGTFDPANPNTSASDAGQIYHYDQLYTQFQIPPNARRYPLVLIHGGGGTGNVWETTPDGREGYQSIFVRRGWPVYIIDMPRRGRAGFPTFNGPFGELAGTPIVPNRTSRSGDQYAFVRWRLGPNYQEYYPNSKFPRTPGALDQFFRCLVPTVDDTTVMVDGLVALLDKIGPAILVSHSQSTGLSYQTAIRSSNVKGIVAHEGSVTNFPTGELPPPIAGYNGALVQQGVEVPKADFLKLAKIPIRVFWGDIDTRPNSNPSRDTSRLNLYFSKQMAITMKRYKGDYTAVSLPDLGIRGNGHFSYLETNNLQIADLVSDFLSDRKLDRR